jgi:predicted transcriptional regulator
VEKRAAEVFRDRSSALFNNCHLVEIVDAIAKVGARKPFTTRQIATETNLADSIVGPVIRRLLGSGLIERTTSTTTGRGRAPNYFRVTASSGWSELKSLCRKLAA